MQGWLKAYAKMGIKGVKFLPLKTFFTRTTPTPSPSLDQLTNSENHSLVPQYPKEGVPLGVCVQNYEQNTLIHTQRAKEREI